MLWKISRWISRCNRNDSCEGVEVEMKEYEWERRERKIEDKNDGKKERLCDKRSNEKKTYRQRAKLPSITCLHALHPSASC